MNHMNVRLAVLSVLLQLCCGSVQAYKYYHDESVFQQFNAMEAVAWIPTGNEWDKYNSYRDMCAGPPYGAKTTHRTLFNSYISKEKDYAEQVDSLYTSRMKSLALETGDRLVDVYWPTQGRRIERELGKFQQAVGLIRSSGGSEEEYHYWKEKYNIIAEVAIPVVRDSYQPGFKRVEQYQAIFQELQQLNGELELCVKRWQAMGYLESLRTRRDTTHAFDVYDISESVMGQWKAALATSSSASPKPKRLKNVWQE